MISSAATRRVFWLVGFIAFMALIIALKPILMPFLVSAFLAYLGNPLVNRLQKFHFPRVLAVLCVFFLILLIVVLFFIILIPALQKQTILLLQKLPEFMTFLQSQILPWANDQAARWHVPTDIDQAAIQNFIQEHWRQSGQLLNQFWQTLSRSSMTIFAWLMNLLLMPVVTFYLLRDWPKLLINCEDLIPRKFLAKTKTIFTQCDEVLSAFFRGQLMVMIALGVLYSLGLSLCGLQASLLIGLLAGLLSIVPYLGFSVGLILALLAGVAQFHFSMNLIFITLVFVIGNVLEGMVLTPWLVGDKIGLHPVAVIFAILAGGHLFGFIGILIALPVAAVLMVLLKHLQHGYKHSSYYNP